MLEIKDLHVSIGEREILKGLTLTVKAGEVAAIMGPNGTGKSTLSYVIAGREGYEVDDRATCGSTARTFSTSTPHERAAKGVFLAFQYPVEIPGVATMTFLKAALNAQRRARGEAGIADAGLHEARQGGRGVARHRRRTCCAGRSTRFFRRREEAHGNLADGAAAAASCAFSTRRIPGSTSTRCASSRTASTRCARPSAPSSSSPITSACSNISGPTSVHVMAQGRIMRVGRSGTCAGARRARLSGLHRARGGISDDQAGERSGSDAFLAFRRDARQGRAARCARPAGTAFSREGVPNRRVEAWHYTDLQTALGRPAPLATAVPRRTVAAARA